jgi:TRAP-type transport system periplasmic protein
MRHYTTLTFILLALAATTIPSGAARADDKIVVKLATLAPEGTTWYNGLRQMGDRWAEISDGRVELKIYAGGVAGNEGAQVRKMRIGQLHAAALSNLGLMDIDPAPQVTNMPMLIESYEELDYVMERISPDLEARLRNQGFVVLNWGEAGWVYFFTKAPMRTPEDASKIKVFAWEGDPAAVEGFRQAGFNPVVIPSVDMIPSLQSGLIDGFPNTPLYALSAQWFALAPNMLDVPWAPLLGATVMTTDMWNQIPVEYHEPFLQVAREIGEDLKEEIRRQDRKAVTVMQKYGLTVVEVDEATKQRWREVARSVYPTVRTEMVPTDVFDRTVGLVEEYRAQNP